MKHSNKKFLHLKIHHNFLRSIDWDCFEIICKEHFTISKQHFLVVCILFVKRFPLIESKPKTYIRHLSSIHQKGYVRRSTIDKNYIFIEILLPYIIYMAFSYFNRNCFIVNLKLHQTWQLIFLVSQVITQRIAGGYFIPCNNTIMWSGCSFL